MESHESEQGRHDSLTGFSWQQHGDAALHQGFQHPSIGSPFQPVHQGDAAAGGGNAARGVVPQPLLPPDGPILAQQNGSQHQHAVPGEPQGMVHGVPAYDISQMQSVSQIQSWINALGTNSAALSTFPSQGTILMPSSLTHQQAAAAGEPRASPPFQGTGAFAPLRPQHQQQDTVHGYPEHRADHQSADNAAAGVHPYTFAAQQAHHPHEAEAHGWEHPLGGGPERLSEQHAADQAPSYSHQQGYTQGAMHASMEAQQHGQSFEHLVEHAAAQHSQHAYGQPKGDGPNSAGPLPRPLPHKPPQATKSSRFRGVYKRQRGGRWEASIVLDGKNCRLGLHLTELAAARAYDRVAIKKWGPEEAVPKINFPVGQYNLADLEAVSMNDLVTTVRAEWRTKEGKSGAVSDPMTMAAAATLMTNVTRIMPVDDVEEGAAAAAKRQRLAEEPPLAADGSAAATAAGAGVGVAPEVTENPADEEETRERVPIPRSSAYRGVSTHKQSGKWVAQLKTGGKQVYLGFYADQLDAARAYDQAVIHMHGEKAETNFPLEVYADSFQQLRQMEFKDLVAALKTHGRGGIPRQPKAETSKFRGVAPDKSKKWRAQITTSAKTTVYLGLWAEEEGAARAYDRANLAKRGESARTNFPLSDYAAELEALKTQPFEGLVASLRAEAVKSVAADRAARHREHSMATGTILAPAEGAEHHLETYQIPADSSAVPPGYEEGTGPDGTRYLAPVGSLGHNPANNTFHAGQMQMGRYPVQPTIGTPRGYILSNHTANPRPEMLFRVVDTSDKDGQQEHEGHQ